MNPYKSMDRKSRVVGIGEILWDLFPQGKILGGAPANFVYHSHALDTEGVLISAVGNDLYGREILEEIKERGIANEFLQLKFYSPTGSVNVKIDENGKPTYIIKENVAWDFIEYTPSLRKLAEEAGAVCFGTLAQRSEISRSTIMKFLKHTDEKCLKIFDINLRGNFYNKEIIFESLKAANCLKLNDEELVIISEIFGIGGNEADILKTLLKNYGLKFIALTKGRGGSCFFSEDLLHDIPARNINIIDTVGAGDAFTAALVVSLLRGCDPVEAHNNAADLAGYVCTKQGAMPNIETKLTYRLRTIT
jgi:fructokinase